MSSLLVFPTSDVIARLEARLKDRDTFVGDAADLVAALTQEPKRSRNVYVATQETGGPIQYSGTGLTIQPSNVQITVALLVRNSRQEGSGAGARKVIEELIGYVRGALIGWAPNGAIDPISFRASRDDNYRSGYAAMQQVFNSGFRIQNENTP